MQDRRQPGIQREAADCIELHVQVIDLESVFARSVGVDIRQAQSPVGVGDQVVDHDPRRSLLPGFYRDLLRTVDLVVRVEAGEHQKPVAVPSLQVLRVGIGHHRQRLCDRARRPGSISVVG